MLRCDINYPAMVYHVSFDTNTKSNYYRAKWTPLILITSSDFHYLRLQDAPFLIRNSSAFASATWPNRPVEWLQFSAWRAFQAACDLKSTSISLISCVSRKIMITGDKIHTTSHFDFVAALWGILIKPKSSVAGSVQTYGLLFRTQFTTSPFLLEDGGGRRENVIMFQIEL